MNQVLSIITTWGKLKENISSTTGYMHQLPVLACHGVNRGSYTETPHFCNSLSGNLHHDWSSDIYLQCASSGKTPWNQQMYYCAGSVKHPNVQCASKTPHHEQWPQLISLTARFQERHNQQVSHVRLHKERCGRSLFNQRFIHEQHTHNAQHDPWTNKLLVIFIRICKVPTTSMCCWGLCHTVDLCGKGNASCGAHRHYEDWLTALFFFFCPDES